MDTVQIEKLLAMKRYAKKQLLISSLIQYSVLGLFLSSPSWLPKLYCAAKLLLSVTMGPKCLFILSNIIIVFLVGESKISRRPPAPRERVDAYEEYACAARRSPGIRSGAVDDRSDEESAAAEDHDPVEECRERDIVEAVEEEKVVVDEERERGGVGEEEEEEERESEEVEGEEEEEEEEEERGLPAEELKRRVEDFIAKVNMQRRLEAMMILRRANN